MPTMTTEAGVVADGEGHHQASAAAAGRPALPRLTSMRGVAALVVFWFHAFGELLSDNESLNNTLVNLIAGPGEASVSCFFMLSGFVLVWVSRQGDTTRKFYRRRIAKVYPNHVVAWTVGVLAFVAVGREFNLMALLPSLLLVQVWIPKASVIEGANGPAWTLACEVFFYALFPFLAVRVARMRRERLWPAVFMLVGAMFAYTVFVGLAVPTEPRTEEGPAIPIAQFYTLFFLPPVRLIEFVAGMVLAHIVMAGRWPQRVNLAHVCAALGVGYILSLVIPAPLGYMAPFLPGIVLLVGLAATKDLAGNQSFMTGRTMMWFGEVSFGFYLMHWIVLRNLRLLIHEGTWSVPATVGYWFLCLALSLVLGRLLFKYVEMPGVRRWSKARGPSRAEATPTSQHAPPVLPPPVNPSYAHHAQEAGMDWPPQRANAPADERALATGDDTREGAAPPG